MAPPTGARARLIVIVGVSVCTCIVRAVSPDMVRLRSQVIESLLLPSDTLGLATLAAMDGEVLSLASSLDASGLWRDVNYNDSADLSEWGAAEHLRRCLILGIAFSTNASAHAHAPAVGAAVQTCTWGWVARDPKNLNWWWQQLGTPQCVAKLLLLSPNATTTAAASVIFERLAFPKDVIGFLGANRVWSALASVLIALVRNNETIIDDAFALMHEAYAPAIPGIDGLQVDGGFHQHGPLAQMSYAYGAHFLTNALAAEVAARGTRWVMSSEAWNSVALYLLDGARSVTRGSEFVPTVCGRHNTYFAQVDGAHVPRGHYHSFAATPLFAGAFPALPPIGAASALSVGYARILPSFVAYPRGAEVSAFAAQVAAGDGSGGWIGHSRFWRSDVTAHARQGFAFVLHSLSNRTLNTECVNGEGLQNRAIGDGALTTHVTGAEYRDVAPTWRWSLVPGTTELQDAITYTCANAQITDSAQRAPFVGGAGDGRVDVACHDMRRTDGDATLVARKAFVFLDDGVIALGAGIAAAPSSGGRATHNVTTSIEQRALAGTVYVGLRVNPGTPLALVNNSLYESGDVAWIWHDGVTYGLLTPPEPASRGALVGVSTRTQVGAWSDVVDGAPNVTLAQPTFLTYIHHGDAATSSSPGAYAYAILPGASTPVEGGAAFLAFTHSHAVVANTPDLHAVCNSGGAAWALHAVFWPPNAAPDSPPTPAPAAAPCPAVSSSHAALVVIAAASDVLTVTAADPMIEGRKATLKLTVEGVTATGTACRPAPGGGTLVTIPLPLQSSTVGSSVTVACNLQV